MRKFGAPVSVHSEGYAAPDEPAEDSTKTTAKAEQNRSSLFKQTSSLSLCALKFPKGFGLAPGALKSEKSSQEAYRPERLKSRLFGGLSGDDGGITTNFGCTRGLSGRVE